ncbi:ABC transporter permease [Lachnotalea glycerini]|uniref:ABC transporter permease n=1 Tax=Lachnotalea glycerini TaxID=1763509 RepID=A0A371J8V2_9FIRM|nr:ABC transporter permease [Lachnotalea glycerini]RDY29107.1 ABC transporter permease [Lachnotalea glycerini]
MSILITLLWAAHSAASQGVLWGIMGLGVYITFRVLDFPDMTCDGSFALGGCVSAVLAVNAGWNPYLTLVIAVLAGGISGAITALLHNKCKIPAILSGILTMTALYSINSRIMGQANIPLIGTDTIVSLIKDILPTFLESIPNFTVWVTLVIGFIFSALAVIFMYWLFGTEIGCAIRATGNNEDMVRALGENTDKMKTYGLVIGNGLVALSGALVAQSQGYADVGMGVGTIVVGLASIVIGEVVMGRARTFKFRLISIILGSVIYRVIIAFVLWMGLKSTDLKLLTALVVSAALTIPKLLPAKATMAAKEELFEEEGGSFDAKH